MHLWEIIGICGISFLLLEIFVPSLFFLNFALSAFLTALVSVFVKIPSVLVIVFFLLSFISFIFLRPLLVKRFVKNKETGVESKYIEQTALAETDIDSNKGVLSIYGERWEARSENGEFIEKGSNVCILRNESIIMYVRKV